MKKLMNRFDATLLILALILSAGFFFVPQMFPRPQASRVEISLNGIALTSLPLDRDGAYTAIAGEGFVEAVIQEGAAHVAAASCRDQLCVRRGRISSAGQSIICLPNRVAVVLTDGDRALDAIIY